MTDEIKRLVGGLGIICGTLLVFLARKPEATERDGFAIFVFAGLLATATGVLVHLFGGERIDRTVLTLAGVVAGLAVMVGTADAAIGSAPAWLIGVVIAGVSAGVVQWHRRDQSSAIAAFAAGISLLLLVGEATAVAVFLLAFGMIVTDILGTGDGDRDRPGRRRWDDDEFNTGFEGEHAADHHPPPSHRSEGHTAGDFAGSTDDGHAGWDDSSTGGEEYEPLPVGGSVGPPGIRSDGKAPAAAVAASTAAATTVAATASAQIQDYLTIGTAPRLLRSTDVSPPLVLHTAPAGHQFDGFRQGPFTIRAASHVGTKHMHGGQSRQDAYAVTRSLDERYLVAAVADGVGSEPWSSQGAEWAVASVVRNAISKNDDHGAPPPSERLAEMAAVEVGHRAEKFGYGAKPHEFSTTLVIAVLDTQDSRLQLTRVGDSNAFTRQQGGWAGHFKTDADVGAATNAIPATTPDIETMETRLEPGGCLLLASDGIADLIANSEEVHRSLFDALATPVSPLEFSSIAGFQRRQAHDDQTALAVWRSNGSAAQG